VFTCSSSIIIKILLHIGSELTEAMIHAVLLYAQEVPEYTFSLHRHLEIMFIQAEFIFVNMGISQISMK
jgi:hypothetical protein